MLTNSRHHLHVLRHLTGVSTYHVENVTETVLYLGSSLMLSDARRMQMLEALPGRSKNKVELRPEGQARWVVNLSKRALTTDQEEVLTKGLNFVPVPTSFPLQDTITGMEKAARKLPEDDAQHECLRDPQKF